MNLITKYINIFTKTLENEQSDGNRVTIKRQSETHKHGHKQYI